MELFLLCIHVNVCHISGKEERMGQVGHWRVERGFSDVIWTDECTVQLETHRHFCCRKKGEAPKNKPR